MIKEFVIKKDLKNILFSFFLPISFLLLFICFNHMDYKDFFVIDLKDQYQSFFYYLKDVFNGEASLFYSFYNGLGESMLGTVLYYLTSPLNIFLYFVPRNHVTLFIFILLFVKIGLCGTTMYLYLKNHFKKKDPIMILFSLTYALSGYIINAYSNIIWFDVIYLSPLVLLGIDKLIEKNDAKFYVVFLFLSIISNCYLSYMLCIFCVLYFFYQLYLLNEEEKKKKIILFFKSSFIVGLLSAFILIPFAIELINVYREQVTMDFSLKQIFSNIIDLFYSFFLKSEYDITSYWKCHLYITLFNIVLIFLYIFNKNIDKREKRITLIMGIIFFLSYIIPFINSIWHGFSVPTGINYRYTFLVTIFLIMISYQSYSKLENVQQYKKRVFLLMLIYSILFFIQKHQINQIYWINLFYILAYYLLLKIIKQYRLKRYMFVLFIVVLLELILHVKINLEINNDSEYKIYEENDQLCEILNRYSSARIEGTIFGTNENLICKKGKININNTMNNKRIFEFFKYSDTNTFYSWIKQNIDTNKVMNSVLGIEYLYTSENISDFYEQIDTISIKNRTYNLYKNNESLSIGFMINKQNVKKQKENNFLYQNSFIKYLTNKEVYFPYEVKEISKNTFEIKITNNNPIFLNIQNRLDFDFYINDEKITIENTFDDIGNSKYGNIYIKNNYENQTIILKIDTTENIQKEDLNVYYLDVAIFNRVIEELSKESLENIEINKNILTGTIEVEEKDTLFLSIPYNKNFTVYVDGKKVKYQALFDTFIGIDLEKGTHQIKLVYFPKYIYCGISLSLLTFIGILFKWKVKK